MSMSSPSSLSPHAKPGSPYYFSNRRRPAVPPDHAMGKYTDLTIEFFLLTSSQKLWRLNKWVSMQRASMQCSQWCSQPTVGLQCNSTHELSCVEQFITIMIISSFCNARVINPLGSLGAAVWQPQRTHRLLNLRQTSRLCTHNERPETMDHKFERIPIFRCRRKPEWSEKTYQGGYGIDKPNSHTTAG